MPVHHRSMALWESRPLPWCVPQPGEMAAPSSLDLKEAAQGCYLIALHACLSGEHGAADELLAQLGCTWRLAPALWDAYAAGGATAQGQPQPGLGPSSSVQPGALSSQRALPPHAACGEDASSCSSSGGGGWVLTADACLPGELLQRLQQGFSVGAAFWEAHPYNDPATPFFSFLYCLVSVPAVPPRLPRPGAFALAHTTQPAQHTRPFCWHPACNAPHHPHCLSMQAQL